MQVVIHLLGTLWGGSSCLQWGRHRGSSGHCHTWHFTRGRWSRDLWGKLVRGQQWWYLDMDMNKLRCAHTNTDKYNVMHYKGPLIKYRGLTIKKTYLFNQFTPEDTFTASKVELTSTWQCLKVGYTHKYRYVNALQRASDII